MATLRDLVDGRTLEAALAPPPTKPGQEEEEETPESNAAGGSPGAQHVAQHIQDPFGTTKADLDELNQKRMEYEMKKAEIDMKLAPVEHVARGIRDMHDMHPLDPNNPLGNPDPGMGYTDPNNPMAGVPGGSQMKPPMGPPGGPPPNMMQQPGQMPPGKPAMGGMVPGAAPKVGIPGQPQGPASSVPPMPPKLGMPQPGQQPGMPPIGGQPGMPGKKPTAPGGWKPAGQLGPKPAPMPNPQQMQYNPGAPSPNGAGSLPGAKGPGDPKVQNKVKKAQSGKSGSNSNGKVAIHVHADSVSMSPAKTTQSSYIGSNSLRSCNDYKKMEAHADDCNCAECEKKREMLAYGTSEGVSKAWDTRGRGRKSDSDYFPGKEKLEIARDKGKGNLDREADEMDRRAQTQGPKNWKDDYYPSGRHQGDKEEYEAKVRDRENLQHGTYQEFERNVRDMSPIKLAQYMDTLPFKSKRAELVSKLNDMSPRQMLEYVSNLPKRADQPLVDSIVKEKKRFGGLSAVAPPGREAQVRKLKKKFGTESAFKIAWSQENK